MLKINYILCYLKYGFWNSIITAKINATAGLYHLSIVLILWTEEEETIA